MQPELIVLITATITAVLTFLLQRRKVNAEAVAILAAAGVVQEGTNASVSGRMDVISQQYFDIRNQLADSKEANGRLAIQMAEEAFERKKDNERWQKQVDELLVKIDGMPQENLDKTAEILSLKQAAAGQPDSPAKPDAELTALAADVKDAEFRVGKPSTDNVLKLGDTVKLVEAKE